MNERFKELAEQANFTEQDIEDMSPGFKKFAELIVQDINNTILHTARWHQEVEKDDNTVMALCALVKDIREEYGVE
jgi:hypothetical protein